MKSEIVLLDKQLPWETEHGFTVQTTDCGSGCNSPSPILTVERLNVAYRGHAVLKDVSISLNRGCITALIGPSGCGKSTFLSCLNRMIDMVPGSEVTGTIEMDGEDIRSRQIDERKLRKRIGMIFQRPNPFPFSIRRNFEIPLRENGVYNTSEIENRMVSALQDVGLWMEVKDKLNRSALSLSGGQQQRLCIARAIVVEPEILLMDEPCSALDPISSSCVEDLIVRMKNRYTVLIVTHNLAQARRIANYVALFWVSESSGKVVEFGECTQIFAAPRNAITADYVSGARG